MTAFPCLFVAGRLDDVNSAAVKFRVICVKILVVQTVLDAAQAIAEALIVYDFALAQEADRVAHIRIIAESQNVVVSRACFLLWYDYKCTTDPETP